MVLRGHRKYLLQFMLSAITRSVFPPSLKKLCSGCGPDFGKLHYAVTVNKDHQYCNIFPTNMQIEMDAQEKQ